MSASSLLLVGILIASIAAAVGSVVGLDWADRLVNIQKLLPQSNAAADRIRRSPSTHLKRDATATQWVTIIIWPNLYCTGTPNMKESFAMGVCFLTPESSDGTLSAEYYWDADADEVYVNFYSDDSCTDYVTTQPYFGGIVPDSCFFGNIVNVATSLPATPNADGRVIDLYTSMSSCSTLESSNLLIHAYLSDTYLASGELQVDDLNPTKQDDTDTCVYFTLNSRSKAQAVNFTETTYYIQWPVTETTKSSCFAGSETVQREDGAVVPISSVVVGDRILTADAAGHNAKHSTVIAVPHDRDNTEAAVFTHLTTASGKDIKMTSEHLVSVSVACDRTTALMQAGEVENGMCLVSVDGIEKVIESKMFRGKGVHTLVTEKEDEMIVVNGLVASPFACNHVVANAYYNIIRWLASFMPPSVMNSNLMKQASAAFGSMVIEFSQK